jgi:glycosyltransferase involved in cell wall biosynthesis
MNREIGNTSNSILSVIIPTYNRAVRLHNCLQALSYQTQETASFEVIVVVDGSTDGTREMLRNLSTPYRLKVLFQANSGQNNARNLGASVASGRYFLFVDDDIVPESNLLEEHLCVQRDRNGTIGIGQIKLKIPSNADSFTQAFAQGWENHYEELNKGIRQPYWMDCYGGNLSVPRTAFESVGGFASDIRRSHDIEFGYRLEQKGFHFSYIASAVGYQIELKGMHDLILDAEKSGSAWVDLYERHPKMLPDLLGSFCETGRQERLLRNLLLHLNIPAYRVSFMGPFFLKDYRLYKWYRFLLSYSYWRGVRKAIPNQEMWKRLTHGTTILLYHAIGGPGENTGPFTVSIRQFKKQMAWLKRMGYHVMSMQEYISIRRDYLLPPAPSVIITFDDGIEDNWKYAFPILRKYRFPALIFLVSDRIGLSNNWSRTDELSGKPLLSLSQIGEMLQAGIDFGAHTRTHPSLLGLEKECLEDEVKGSRIELERMLDVPILFFSYPYGEFDSNIRSAVEEAGFLASCTVESGLNTPSTDTFTLRRRQVLGTESILQFILNFV